MADSAARETERIRADLLRSLNRLYNSADRQIQEEIEEYLDAIILYEEEATQRQRIKHAEKNGLDEIVAAFVAVMLLTNEKAIDRINNAMNNVAGINYNYVRDYVKKQAGVDIGGTADAFKANRYTRRAYDRNTQSKYVSDSVMKEIKAGIKKGENVKSIEKRILRASNKSAVSARTTAKTETTRIRAAARLDAMEEADKKYGVRMKKVWRHSFFVKEPRHWHQDMDGVSVYWDEDFDVDGIPMSAPGDPAGGAENNCNCGCFIDIEVE